MERYLLAPGTHPGRPTEWTLRRGRTAWEAVEKGLWDCTAVRRWRFRWSSRVVRRGGRSIQVSDPLTRAQTAAK